MRRITRRLRQFFNWSLLLILGSLIFFGCQPSKENKALLLKDLENIRSLRGNIIDLGVSYWSLPDMQDQFHRIQAKDTLTQAQWITSRRYELSLKNDLRLKKIVRIHSKDKVLLSETDIYYKKLDTETEASLSLSYDYEKSSYEANYTDIMASPATRLVKQEVIDSLVAQAHKDGYWYDGTGLQDSIWGAIPLLPVPRSISLDSAKVVLAEWESG